MRIISAKEAVPFVHNAWETFFDAQGLLNFRRFTEKQAARYRYDTCRISDNDLYTRTFASSNITLEMDTDSAVFGLNFRWRNRVNHGFASFDMLADGCLCGHLWTDKEKCKLLSFRLPGDGKLRRVQLFFPWGGEARLESIVLSDGAAVTGAVRNIIQ